MECEVLLIGLIWRSCIFPRKGMQTYRRNTWLSYYTGEQVLTASLIDSLIDSDEPHAWRDLLYPNQKRLEYHAL